LERELPEVGSAFSPASVGENADALCALFAYLTGPNRVVTTARLVLFLEGSHDDALREALPRGRAPWRPPRSLRWPSWAHVIPSLLAPPSPPAPKDCSCTTLPGTTTRIRGRGFDLVVRATLA
jgi:hypothetical protein